MNTKRKSQTLNYENPEIIEIELAPQGVLCGSATGTGESSNPGIVLQFGSNANDEDDLM